MKKILASVALAGALVLTTSGCEFPVNEQTMTCTVTDKESVLNATKTHEYRIYTDECGTLANYDAWGKWNSADVQGELHEGETYVFTTWGWRNGPMSMFPNIVEVDHIDE